jgi:hypothetical protein
VTELPESVQRRVEYVNSLLPDGWQLDTTPIIPTTAAEGRGLLGPDFLGGQDPVDYVRSIRDAAPPLPTYPRSRDFVPEPYPRPGRYEITDEELAALRRAASGADDVLECPRCGTIWDGSGPAACPECEDVEGVPLGATWDED